MSSTERRIDTRLNIRVPLRFRALNKVGLPELIEESENLSRRGIYFSTKFPIEIGTVLEVTLRMPKELFGHMAHEVRCTARVVRVNDRSSTGGRVGIGLYIERYEPAVLKRERWAS